MTVAIAVFVLIATTLHLYVSNKFYMYRKHYWKYVDKTKDYKRGIYNKDVFMVKYYKRRLIYGTLAFIITFVIYSFSMIFLISIMPTVFLTNTLIIIYGCYMVYVFFKGLIFY